MLIIPFTMGTLNPTEFGTLSLITSFVTIGTAIMGLGLRQVISIEYFHCVNSTEKRILINDIICVYLATGLPSFVMLFRLKHLFIKYIFFNIISPQLFTVILGTIFLSFFVELLYQILQYERQAINLITIQTLSTIITGACTVFFLWHLSMGISGIVLAQLLSAASIALCALTCYLINYYHLNIQLKKSISKASHFITYGFPFVPGIIFSWIMASSDRWILGYYCSMHEVGIYATADMFAQLFNVLVLQSWAASYLPYIMKQYHNNKNNLESIEHNNRRVMFYCMGFLFVGIGLGFLTLHAMLRKILPLHYHQAIHHIWTLLTGQVFLLGTYFCSSLIQFHKKKFFMVISLAIPASLNILLNILFVPYLSIQGATLATLLAYIIYFLVTYKYNKLLTDQKAEISPQSVKIS